MKRGAFGCILLIALFFFSLTGIRTAHQELSPIARRMDMASEAALQSDWQKTAALTREARAAWEDYRFKYSCLSQQEDVREIDGLYDEVQVFLKAGESVHCSAACAALKNQLLGLLEDQKLSFPSLL